MSLKKVKTRAKHVPNLVSKILCFVNGFFLAGWEEKASEGGHHRQWSRQEGRQGRYIGAGLRIRTFLVGSGAGFGKFSPDPDPIGSLAMESCITRKKYFKNM